MRVGLRGRMLAASAVLAALVATAFTIVVLEIRNQHEASRLAQRAAEVIASANALERLAIDLQTAGRGFVITGEERFLDPWRNARARIPAQAAELERLILDPRQRERARGLAEEIREFDEAYVSRVIEAARSDRARAAELVAAGEGKRRMDDIRAQFARFAEVERRIVAEREATAESQLQRAIAFGVGGLVGSVLLVLLFAGYLSRSIVAPVRRAAIASGLLAAGNLSARVPAGGAAEVGELGRAFNDMASSLEESRDELESQNAELEAQQGELEAQQVELEAQQVELEGALTDLGEEKARVDSSFEFGKRLAVETDLAVLAPVVLAGLCDFAEAELGTLYGLENEEVDELALLTARGLDQSRLPAHLRPDQGLAGRAATEGRVVTASYGETGLRLAVFGEDVAVGHEAHVPIVYAERTLAVATLARIAGVPFSPEQCQALEHLAAQAAVALANALSFDTARRNASINESVLNATREGISLVDSEGRTVFQNSAMERMRSEIVGDVDGSTALERMEMASERVSDPGRFLELMRAALADPEYEAFEELEVGERSFQLYTSAVWGPEREFIGRIFNVRDISAERQAERLKSDLVATVSHELRTPLASILGYAELLVARDLDEETRTAYLDTIYHESKRLTTLINDFLDLQRIEEGGITLSLEPFDLREVVRRQTEVFRGQSLAHAIEVSLPDAPLVVLGESERIAQVLGNLLSNAIKYSPEGGVVEVSAVAEAGSARVSVRDAGLGIPAGQQRHLFTKFFRVDTPERRGIGGTGLGLSLVREIVDAHGGGVGFQSVEGQGSTFWFELPIGSRADGVRDGRVLVIEDDPAAAHLLATYLGEAGYEIEIAATGEDGLARATDRPPAVICLDIVLPGKLDGWQVLAHLKARPATARVPVIVCTGKNGRDRASALGASDFLTKPVSPGRIKQAVTRVLPGAKGSVLVVDDEENVRRLVAETLSGNGVEVREAADGVEALAAIEAEHPSAIVLDLVMPGLDGFGVLERLQEDDATRSIPVIVLTARKLSADERDSLHRRAVSLLEKSAYSPAELRRLVARAVGAPAAR